MILRADARSIPLRDESVQCCITSPPYWGLRNYGVDGQLGLEKTPEEYVANMVAVFREVRRVLKDDGVLWLNLGDSYAAGKAGRTDYGTGDPTSTLGPSRNGLPGNTRPGPVITRLAPDGLKPKDLVGIPWLVAKALQSPYYTGRIKSETDRAWLAGFLDGEGTITFVERDRGENHASTHDARIFITNCDDTPLRHFAEMTAGNVYQHDGERDNRFGSRPCYRWQMGTHDGALLLRELYPFLRTKRKQAVLIWTLYTTLRHKNGHARTPDDVIDKRQSIAGMVRSLNRGESVDLPQWVDEPPPATEPGWYLRSDIIWSKPNPMPESVTDRPTKAHEYIFLLSKSAKYYYNAGAIAEPIQTDEKENYPARAHILGRGNQDSSQAVLGSPRRDNSGGYAPRYGKAATSPRNDGDAWNENNGRGFLPSKRWPGIGPKHGESGERLTSKDRPYAEGMEMRPFRNRRTVWSIATQPYSGSHFATFPEEIPRLCILAGSRPGDVILDPFGGSGTTSKVALELGRKPVHIDLTYHELARKRMTTTPAMAGLMG